MRQGMLLTLTVFVTLVSCKQADERGLAPSGSTPGRVASEGREVVGIRLVPPEDIGEFRVLADLPRAVNNGPIVNTLADLLHAAITDCRKSLPGTFSLSSRVRLRVEIARRTIRATSEDERPSTTAACIVRALGEHAADPPMPDDGFQVGLTILEEGPAPGAGDGR